MQNGIYKFSWGTPPYLCTCATALCASASSRRQQKFILLQDLGYLCRKKKFMLQQYLGFLCRKTTLGLSQGMIQRGWRIHSTYLKNLNLPLNVLQKFTLQNAKPILLKTIFSLFYINALKMSDSFIDVMSSLASSCKLPLVNK